MGRILRKIKAVWSAVAQGDTAWALLGYIGWTKAVGSFVSAAFVSAWAYIDGAPGWAVLLVGLLVFCAMIWGVNGILWVRDRRRNMAHDATLAPLPETQLAEYAAGILCTGKLYENDAHEELALFVVEFVTPASEALASLQRSIISNGDAPPLLREYASLGLPHRASSADFWSAFYEASGGLRSSPMVIPCLTALVSAVEQMERGYKNACAQTEELAVSVSPAYESDPVVRSGWEQWRVAHNKLVAEYDKIKRQSKFGKLHRLRPSRWGGQIPELRSDEPLLSLLPPNIAAERQR